MFFTVEMLGLGGVWGYFYRRVAVATGAISGASSGCGMGLVTVATVYTTLVAIAATFVGVPSPLKCSRTNSSVVCLTTDVLPKPFKVVTSSVNNTLTSLVSNCPR